MDGLLVEPAVVQVIHRFLRILLTAKLRVKEEQWGFSVRMQRPQDQVLAVHEQVYTGNMQFENSASLLCRQAHSNISHQEVILEP